VVLMNPPFGEGSLVAKAEFDASYPRTRNDVYAAFVERGVELLQPGGLLGAITSRTGFFLSSFRNGGRRYFLRKRHPLYSLTLVAAYSTALWSRLRLTVSKRSGGCQLEDRLSPGTGYRR
jgi:hypothetical protein